MIYSRTTICFITDILLILFADDTSETLAPEEKNSQKEDLDMLYEYK